MTAPKTHWAANHNLKSTPSSSQSPHILYLLSFTPHRRLKGLHVPASLSSCIHKSTKAHIKLIYLISQHTFSLTVQVLQSTKTPQIQHRKLSVDIMLNCGNLALIIL